MYTERVSIVIPSYDPDEKLEKVVSGLVDRGFDDIIVINDGSKPECRRYFDAVLSFSQCTVIDHEVNRGKGAALKTAIGFFMENRPDRIGIVTADGDAQHSTEDICSVAQALCETPDTFIIGARDFDLPQVPKRSRTGNKLTSFVFRTGLGMKISDTQSGLRGIPASTMEVMGKLKGDRYEYETNALLALKDHSIPFREIPINTVYIDENATSHFRVVRDSVRIYANLLRYAASSIVCMLFELLLFYTLSTIFEPEAGSFLVSVLALSSRAASSVVNYTINRHIVFGSSNKRSILRYFSLVVVQGLISAGLTSLLTAVASADTAILQTVLKFAVDTVLFFGSYFIQRKWVFADNKK